VSVSGTGPVVISARAVAPSCPLPSLDRITLWPGPSGAYAVPAAGTSVRVAFADGDPTKPMIVGLDPASAPTMIYLGAPGPAVARVGDTVAITQAELTAAGAVAGGNPVTIATPIQASITTGSAKVQSP